MSEGKIIISSNIKDKKPEGKKKEFFWSTKNSFVFDNKEVLFTYKT